MSKSEFLLALSTSSGVAHVVAVQAKPDATQLVGTAFDVLFDFSIAEYRQQSAELLPRLASAMQAAGLSGAGCVAIAVDIGPGGFTSLRTACGVAQGLATAWQVPCVPLSSFECMAATGALLSGSATTHCATENVACMLDARLQEVYGARLSLRAERSEWHVEPGLLPFTPDAARVFAGQASKVVCDSPVHTELLQGVHNVQAPGAGWALGLAALALVRFNHGVKAEPLQCQPLYVREKVAQTTQERRAARDVDF